MEKHFHSFNNYILVHHLPRILNLVQIMNMMMYGFVNNQPILFVQAIGSLQKSIPLPTEQQLRKWLIKQLYTSVKLTYYILLSAAVLLLAFSNYFTANAIFIAGILVLPALVIRLCLIHKGIVAKRGDIRPVNQIAFRGWPKNYGDVIRSTFHTIFLPIHYS